MRHYLRYLTHKLKNEPWQQLFLDIYGKAGLRITPYYLVMEGRFGDAPPLPAKASKYTVRFLGPEDMAQIAAMPERSIREPLTQKWFEEGNLCFGMLCDETIIAFVWCNLETCHFWGHPFPLAENEAYIFDAHTSKDYRGAGIAPYLRYRLYEEMEKRGKTCLYSYTSQLNRPAQRFKLKLNARVMGKGLSILFLKRWHLVSRFTPCREYADIADRWKAPPTIFSRT